MADRPLKLGKSSQIHDGTYDPSTERLTLTLNGSVHAYHNVPSHLVDGLEKADSHGDYFHKNIRNVHKVSRVR